VTPQRPLAIFTFAVRLEAEKEYGAPGPIVWVERVPEDGEEDPRGASDRS